MSLHLEAKMGDVAETVLLPGDPLRAKFVAENLMEDAVCYNKVRGMYGFTGTYKGKRVSIQGSGMGMPSLSIYVNELFMGYGVKNVIRVGTCGAIREELKVGQVLLGMSASGDTNANRVTFKGLDFAPTADFELLSNAARVAKEQNINAITGPIFSTDSFYGGGEDRWDVWAEHGILATEMESQMLYTLAAKYGGKALSILTVSDNIVTGENSSNLDREQSFTDMMKIALEIA